MRSLALCLIVGSASFLVAPLVHPDNFVKEKAATLVVPLPAFRSDTNIWSGRKYTTSVTCDEVGRIVLNGNENWRTGTLPAVMEGKIDQIKPKPKDGYTLLVITATPPGSEYDRNFRFMIQSSCKDWEAAMTEIVVLTSKASDSYNQEIAARLTPYYEWQANQVFVGGLSHVDQELQIKIISTAHRHEPSCGFSVTEFRNVPYISVDLRSSDVVYNSLQVNQNQRVAREITNRVFPLLKELAPIVNQAEGVGLNIQLSVGYKDFLQEDASPDFDTVSMFINLDMAVGFANFDVTDQELIDGSVVLINENRSEVDISDQ